MRLENITKLEAIHGPLDPDIRATILEIIPGRLYTLEEASAFIGVEPDTLGTYRRAEMIGHCKYGYKDFRFPGASIINFLTGWELDELRFVLACIDRDLYRCEQAASAISVTGPRLGQLRRGARVRGRAASKRKVTYTGPALRQFVKSVYVPGDRRCLA